MNAIDDEESDFDEKVVFWVEGQELPSSLASAETLEPFSLYMALKGEKPWLIKDLLDEMSLSPEEIEEIKDAILTQIVVLNSADDEEYLERFREFKSLLNAACGSATGDFLSPDDIRRELRKSDLPRTKLVQLKRSISLSLAWSLSDEDELRRETLELTALLGELEDRLRMM